MDSSILILVGVKIIQGQTIDHERRVTGMPRQEHWNEKGSWSKFQRKSIQLSKESWKCQMRRANTVGAKEYCAHN
jgi:hypothetical protein